MSFSAVLLRRTALSRCSRRIASLRHTATTAHYSMDFEMESRMLVSDATRPFLWIVIIGGFMAFFAAFGIGANDVANAFATSVGSKALTLRQAISIAAVAEFSGAVLMGSHVTKTIRSGIAEVGCFTSNPGILMYGMMCVDCATGIWLLLASYLELPVSTTHSTVGGIIGMAMTYKGADCVQWHEKSDLFPYVKGVSAIVASWFISPVLSGLITLCLFFVVRALVLRSDKAVSRALMLFPVLVACTVAVNVFFIVYKGAPQLKLDETPISEAFAWAFGLGALIGILVIFLLLPHVKKNIAQLYNEDGTEKPVAAKEAIASKHTGLRGYVEGQLNQDMHKECLEGSAYVSGIHSNAEKFDPRSEEVFKFVQVFTAICDSFAHGANDVANAVGPFSTVYFVYKDGTVTDEADTGSASYAILAWGGFGIVCGLTVYGYKIISAIGVKIAKITPSRGFAIELGSAITVIIGTRLELPLSTTHCQVGSTAGVALLEGVGGLNMVVFGKSLIGWAVTVIICALTAALLFAQGAYAPYVGDTIS